MQQPKKLRNVKSVIIRNFSLSPPQQKIAPEVVNDNRDSATPVNPRAMSSCHSIADSLRSKKDAAHHVFQKSLATIVRTDINSLCQVYMDFAYLHLSTDTETVFFTTKTTAFTMVSVF